MPGGFRIRVTITRPNAFALLATRLLEGFGDLFKAIIERWQEHNEDKFDRAQGASQSGVDFGGDVFWEPLTVDYFAAKTKEYDDWLMVRDADLIESLTNPGAAGWFQEVTQRYARFGTTLPQAAYNWEKRPTMFLDQWDQDMVRDLALAFLGGKAPFKEWQPAPTKVFDAEFRDVVAV